MRGIHDRMPVIIQRKDETAWLDPKRRSSHGAARAPMNGSLPGIHLVNSLPNDGRECAEPFRDSLFEPGLLLNTMLETPTT
jgi:putative SOS response-associated peptidase YedK